MRLSGMKAMVTGAASGFGAGIARAMAAEGAAVMVADLNAKGAAAVAADLPGAASRGVDVTAPETLEAAVAACEAQLGGLDVLVANAGVGQRPASLADTDPDVLRQQFEVNAVGAANSCRAALPALRRSTAGASILITVSGIALVPRPGLYGYGMSKMAAMYLMKALALELAPEGIRVNGLFPAVGDTPMLAEFAGGERTAENETAFAAALPLGRLITPEDVGAAAVWLSSPAEAGAMTGCALPVDAGRCI